MIKKDILIGFVAGIIAAILGCIVFILIFTNYNIISGIQILKSEGKLGKLITLGAILDLVVFGLFLKLNKEIMARGVVLAVIIIAILTLFA